MLRPHIRNTFGNRTNGSFWKGAGPVVHPRPMAPDFPIRVIHFEQPPRAPGPTTLTGYESRVRDFRSMMDFILRLQTTQNRDRVFNGGFFNGNWLESPLERGVFSDSFAVLIRCRTPSFKCGMVRSFDDAGQVAGMDETLRCELLQLRRKTFRGTDAWWRQPIEVPWRGQV